VKEDNTSLIFWKSFLIASLGAGLLIWFSWFVFLDSQGVGIDDANIFKVYAQNLSHGLGFVYQPGGERVEGFTSLLYTLLLSFAYKITGNLDVSGLLIGLSTFLAVVVLTTKLAYFIGLKNQKLLNPEWSARIILVWMLASPYFVIWLGVSQMDTGLWTLMLLLALNWCLKIDVNRLQWRQILEGGVIMSLLVLTRPEGMLVGLLMPMCWVLKGLLATRATASQSHEKLVSFHQVIMGGWLFLFWLAGVAGLTGFRLQYFGWPLPNTFYAKVSPDAWYRIGQGLLYAGSFLWHQPIMLAVIWVWGWVTHNILKNVVKRQTQETSIHPAEVFGFLVLWLFLGLLFLIPIFNGGDHFAGWRMYQPLWPVAGLLTVFYLVYHLPNWLRKIFNRYSCWPVCAGFFMLIIISQPYLIGQNQLSLSAFGSEFAIAKVGRQAGALLNSWFKPDQPKPVVGVIAAGGLALTYWGEVYDLLGLNEPSVAHDGGERKGIKNHASLNARLVEIKKPDILFPLAMLYAQVSQITHISQALSFNTLFAQTLFASAPLAESYRLVWISQTKLTPIGIHPTTVGIVCYIRQDYLDQLQATGMFQVKTFDFK